MMSLTLEEALQRPTLSIDELNSLLPQTVQAVLAQPEVGPGSQIGSWEVVETDQGVRGFQAELPDLALPDVAKLCQVLQIEPYYLVVALQLPGSDYAMQGFLDLRPTSPEQPPIAPSDHDVLETVSQAVSRDEADLEATLEDLQRLTLLMVAWMLNTDLFDHLAGRPVQRLQDIREQIAAELTGSGGKSRKRKKPRS